MRLRLRRSADNELSAYFVLPDNSDGCRVAFAQRQYAAGHGAERYDGAVVSILEMYTAHHENSACRKLGHHNYGYAQCEVVEFAQRDGDE